MPDQTIKIAYLIHPDGQDDVSEPLPPAVVRFGFFIFAGYTAARMACTIDMRSRLIVSAKSRSTNSAELEKASMLTMSHQQL